LAKEYDAYSDIQAKAYNEYTTSEKARKDAIKALDESGAEGVDNDGISEYTDE